ncbi:FliH/SctL family protein [Paenibacillus larvae]
MILLSNLIKSLHYVELDDAHTIRSVQPKPPVSAGAEVEPGMSQEEMQELHDTQKLKETILKDAEQYAEEQIQQAMQECADLREQAEQEISSWWEQRRSDDIELIEELKDQGYEEGFRKGSHEALDKVREEHAGMLAEARTILEQSYQLKERIIQESEPFLIDLSCSIAEKIIQHQLTLSPEWVKEMIQGVLSRRREKGTITLCVSPKHFAYIQDAREELLTSIDSLAELEILPDPAVKDHGCVIRSTFGSIDARIDTQLKEIKHALRQISIQDEGEGS